MSAKSSRLSELPLVLIATCATLVLPVFAIISAEVVTGVALSPFVTAPLGAAMSMALGWLGARVWLRNPRSKDLLFSDLMIWGWTRRLVHERLLSNAAKAFRVASPKGQELDPKAAERLLSTLKRLAVRLEAQDPYTHGHTRRVARHSYMIAKTLGLSRDVAQKVRTAAAVHDVGKMHIPAEVLHKSGRLTDEEFDLIKMHSVFGAEMVADAGDDELTAIVRHHHERIDGRGYPDRLEGDAIPLGARIIAVADTFDAITSARSYRDASPHLKAIEIITKEAGAQLDGEAVDAFLRYYHARKGRRFAAVAASAPDKALSWFAGIFRQAGRAVAMGTATAASVAAIAAPMATPSPDGAKVFHGSQVASATSGETSATTSTASDSGDDEDGGARGRAGAQEPADRTNGSSESGSEPGDETSSSDPTDTAEDQTSAGSGSETADPTDPGSTDPGSDGSSPDDGGGVVDDTTDSVNDTVGDTTDTVGDTVDDTTDTVGGGTGDVVDDVVDTVDEVGGGLIP